MNFKQRWMAPPGNRLRGPLLLRSADGDDCFAVESVGVVDPDGAGLQELIDDEVGVFVARITRGWNDDRFDARRARGVADVLRERLLPVDDVYFPFALEYVVVELEGFLNVGIGEVDEVADVVVQGDEDLWPGWNRDGSAAGVVFHDACFAEYGVAVVREVEHFECSLLVVPTAFVDRPDGAQR